MTHPATQTRYDRKLSTRLSYAGAAIFGFTVGGLGPAMPHLRSDLDLNRAIGGLHISGVAVTAIVFGLTIHRLVPIVGRRVLFWLGGAGVSVGGLALALGPHVAVTIAGAMLIGAGGTTLLNAFRSSLSTMYGDLRAVALSRADASWAAGAMVPGLLIGLLAASGLGWRPVFLLPMALWVALFVMARGIAFPEPEPRADSPSHMAPKSALPRPYWIYWSAMLPSGAAEWCLTVWAAGYLVDRAGISEGAASLLLAAYFAAMVTGRLIGGVVSSRVQPRNVFRAAIGVAIGGVCSFWLIGSAPIRIVGLLSAGLGTSLLYPMLISLAVGVAADRPDSATARVSTAAGTSMLIAPFALGWVADQIGIFRAFVLVPALFIGSALLAEFAHRSDRLASLSAD